MPDNSSAFDQAFDKIVIGVFKGDDSGPCECVFSFDAVFFASNIKQGRKQKKTVLNSRFTRGIFF